MRAAVFLDRDGVLNRNVWNAATQAYESPLSANAFELFPDTIPSLRRLAAAGYLLFLVSNQPNYAKGKASMETLDAIHAKLMRLLDADGIEFAASYYCFHHPEFTGACVCRKPSPHFLLEAHRAFGVELSESWMIGDRPTDIACGRSAGTRTILIGEQTEERAGATGMAKDLPAAVGMILASRG